MEVAQSDQSTGIQWRNGIDLTTGATATGIGAGPGNTNTIISAQGIIATDYAAGLARAYNGGGLNDWFLPSNDELKAIWDNLVNDGLGNNSGIGGFTSTFYWSSTEGNASYSWYLDFTSGAQSTQTKSISYYVRAIRNF
jgi:hypothetical protein